MLDYPDPFSNEPPVENAPVCYSHDTLAFLDETLHHFAQQPAIIFAHCPLRDTVLARDHKWKRDHDSLERGFYVENSKAVRGILARHGNALLYISGHTHSGWGAPRLVTTERLGVYTLTHLNVMSPWYSGRQRGPRRIEGPAKFAYVPDEPDIQASFAVSISSDGVVIRARDHQARRWLAQWKLPPRQP